MNPDSSGEVRLTVKEVVERAMDKKAENLIVFDVSRIAFFTDYFLIMTVQSARQAQAICDAVVESLKKKNIRPLHNEGYRSGSWILLDYVDFIVHIFQPEPRDFYALERLWGDAPDITDEFLA